MHPRNRYRDGHNFTALVRHEPALGEFLVDTPDGHTSLDFSNREAVRLLNRTLLMRDYGLRHWDVPHDNLIPAVPGRLDYIHALADLIGTERKDVVGIDIGTGPSCIYPILGVREYGWRFVASDNAEESLKVARAILRFNPGLDKYIELRDQSESAKIYYGIIRPGERYAFTMCNPPFYASRDEAEAATRRKWQQLGKASNNQHRNFGGRANELWTPGGEAGFLRRTIAESAQYRDQVEWFTTLVSQRGYLKAAYQQLNRLGFGTVRVLPLEQGKKVRRVLCWG